MPRWLAGLLLAILASVAWVQQSREQQRQRALILARAGQGSPARGARGRSGEPNVARRYPQSWAEWKEVLWRLYAAIGDDRLMAVAAGVVFYALLALFPAVTAFVSLYGLFTDPLTVSRHLSLLAGVLPAGAFEILGAQIARIAAIGGGHLGLGFIFGLGLALWSANAGMKAMIDALNVIYRVPETRNFIRLNLVSLSLTLGAIVMTLLLIGAVVVFPLLTSLLGVGAYVDSLMPLLRWPIIFVVVLLALAVLYRFGPSPHGARWRWITPGSVFAAATWLLGSALLSWYLANFAHYDATYGSLGAAIGLMMWMWMSSIVVLLGGQLNALLDRWPEPLAQRPSGEPLAEGA